MIARTTALAPALLALACAADPADADVGTGSTGPEPTSTTASATSSSTAVETTVSSEPTTTGDASETSSGSGADTSGTETSSGSTGALPSCTALLCEDFEDPAGLDPATWTIDAGYDPENTVVVQSDVVAAGAGAAHAHIAETGGGFAQLRESVTFPALADELWGRAYVWDTLSVEAGHSGYVSAYVDDRRVLEIGQSQGNWQLTYYQEGGESPHGSAGVVPHGEWVCFEWRFARMGDNLIEIYIGGDMVDSYAAEGIEIPPFTSITLGLDNHSANPPGNDVYLDDVAIDAARIGCE